MTHEEALELAGLYALDALTPDEKAAVDAHMAACAEDHSDFAHLGGVTPALATMAEPLDAPPELKGRVMAAVAAAAADDKRAVAASPGKMPGRYSTPGGRVTPAPEPRPAPAVEAPSRGAWRMPVWTGWAAAAVAVLVLAVVGVYALGLQSQLNQSQQEAAVLSDALAAYAAPDSQTAILDDANSNATGFAAVSADGTAYVVMSGLEPAPSGKTYQAWFIANGAPVSAGLATVGADGLMVMSNSQPAPGTTAVALTLEPAGGSEQPTSDPFAVGTLG
jgi:anti-sigma-K factor RskA